MRAAAIFQLSSPSDRIGTNRKATTVPIIVATVIQIERQVIKDHKGFTELPIQMKEYLCASHVTQLFI